MTAQTDHDHHWVTASVHPTSEGRISYQSCACGRWRVLRDHVFSSVLAAAE